MAIAIGIRGVTRMFGQVAALGGIDVSIAAGEFFTLLGSSGCGKSTLLKLIGGFDRPTSGDIVFDGKSVLDVPANRRPVNTVFQNLALFPHMTVAENIGYGLKLRGLTAAAIARKVDDALELVELSGFGPRRIGMMSGGQRQRVALARALVMEPGILLLDEPLTGLDERLRQQMRDEFRRLHQRTGATFILVTHNQDEALSLSHRMAVMHRGRIEQVDAPARFFEEPANAFVARFIGIETLLKPDRLDTTASGAVAIIAGQPVPLSGRVPTAAGDLVVALRPDRLAVSDATGPSDLALTLLDRIFRGLTTELRLAFADGQQVLLSVPSDGLAAGLTIGSTVSLAVAKGGAMAIPNSTIPTAVA